MAIFSHDWKVGVWDTATGKLEFRWDAPEGDYIDNSALKFSPDGKNLVISAGTGITMWNLSDGSVEKQWKGLPPGLQNELAFDENGRLLLVRFETTGESSKSSPSNVTKRTFVCRVRNLLNRLPQKVVVESEMHFRKIDFIYFSNDTNQFLVVGNSLKTANENRENYVFETSTGKKLWSTDDQFRTLIREKMG